MQQIRVRQHTRNGETYILKICTKSASFGAGLMFTPVDYPIKTSI